MDLSNTKEYQDIINRQGTYTEQLETELAQSKINQMNLSRGQNIYNENNNDNLIVYQLSMQEELDRIYHLLSGDIKIDDGKGNVYYVKCTEEEKPFNDFGVQRIINKISFYLHKGIILGYYLEPEEFFFNLKKVSQDIADYILDNFMQMGMDTEDKIKMYPFIVDALKDNIVSAYRRSLYGRELNSLRSARLVTQKEGDIQGGTSTQSTPEKKWYNKLW